MVRAALVAVLLSFASFGCAASRAATTPRPAAAAPTEITFARGLLRTVSPGPDWIAGTNVLVQGPNGARVQYPLMLRNPKTGSYVAVLVYETAAASPVLMADRLQMGMKEGNAAVSEVDFSLEDGSRASFTFTASDGDDVACGKAMAVRLNGIVSVVVIGTWTPPASDEAAFDAVVAALAMTAPESR